MRTTNLLPGWTSLLQLAQSKRPITTNGPVCPFYGETPTNTFETTQTGSPHEQIAIAFAGNVFNSLSNGAKKSGWMKC